VSQPAMFVPFKMVKSQMVNYQIRLPIRCLHLTI